MHLDLDDPIAAASLAAAALYIKAEPALIVPLGLGVRSGGEQVPDQVKYPGVGSRIGPGGAADGGLVDGNDLIQLLRPLDGLVLSGDGTGPVQLLGQGLVEDLVNQGAFSGAGHAGNAGHHPQWEGNIDILQIVLRRSLNRNPACGASAFLWNRNGKPSGEISASDGSRAVHDLLGRADGHHFSAMFSRSRPDIHNTVRRPHGILVVLYHQHAVSQIPQI